MSYTKPSTTEFPLGQIVITATARSVLNPAEVHEALQRHASGDWGNLCEEDAEQNRQALGHGGRLFSAYGEGAGRFWIITESDRSATTVLMPQDY